MVKIISIVGTTASGKTAIAFEVAEMLLGKFPGVIILSADSKQVYKDIPILSGADIPKSFVKAEDYLAGYSYFKDISERKLLLTGMSMLDHDQEWSVALFQEYAQQLLKEYPDWAFVIEGGTGLYHALLCNNKKFAEPDKVLRAHLQKLSLVQLQKKTLATNPDAYEALNNSDVNNPRRLIRVLERTAAGDTFFSGEVQHSHTCEHDHSWIGIKADASNIKQRIKERVKERIAAGVIDEVRAVEEKGQVSETLSAALGYQLIVKRINKEISRNELERSWALAEFQYAKRQMTWFAKQKNISWFEKDNLSILKLAEMILGK